ncbi:MAG: hypothetical protein BSOLF_0894 [Candidatus Carbobacillus altaicus]|uniref:Uncharacterized protein n=1 Tax=Candidatus Carbonibacillus altaicus TaxID=2163959 RepID=A0A2R6Y4T5_9BACL|nr:MAG: hypothetical protein BSOLF_0894 [Candidatus Carbobacillus altaicus]
MEPHSQILSDEYDVLYLCKSMLIMKPFPCGSGSISPRMRSGVHCLITAFLLTGW